MRDCVGIAWLTRVGQQRIAAYGENRLASGRAGPSTRRSDVMPSKVTRTMLVVVTALTLAVGALGVTGGLGLDWGTAQMNASIDGGAVGNRGN
jgi:hypothetical protein